jgi:hypothetical protein
MTRKIRPPEESPYSAMTVNERLAEAGLLYQFDEAAFAHDEEKIRDVLALVDLGDGAAGHIIEWIKSSPHSMYRKKG